MVSTSKGNGDHEPLTASQLSRFERRLEIVRGEVDQRMRELEADLDSIRKARSDASSDDEHDPEGSTLSSDWSRIEGLRRNSIAQLSALDRARTRLANGTYGFCERCGRPIDVGRLNARPAADYCILCARELEP